VEGGERRRERGLDIMRVTCVFTPSGVDSCLPSAAVSSASSGVDDHKK